ncbi:MAG TPA: thiamine pyrophosphate-dependent enzyme [Candidatus Eisenbacteria bacterium]|nr:thiamine pyrophosphate-dependent enzyme [Candidatus Eisenbacteria bacterium]
MSQRILLGDESVALGAIHAGLSAAYGYPGTPSTEILEYLLDHHAKLGAPHAAWCANEKTAYEEALGVSFAGRRALVSMKHVGLNVAADPFVNSALVAVHGGFVVAVADDPGMHSSQNEQDSRYLAEFARVLCLEPATQQEAYSMTREAFELSERFRVPVLLRLVTRLAHSRTMVQVGEARAENPIRRAPKKSTWILLPMNARRQWKELVDRQSEFLDYTETCGWNGLALRDSELGVITTGIARNYFHEACADLPASPSHLHVGAYPIPTALVRKLAAASKRILVLEDGQPFVESRLRGLLPPAVAVLGRMSGEVPATGELSPDLVRAAFGLPERAAVSLQGLELPGRPPQLCDGCPHGHAFHALLRALGEHEKPMVTSDIGCYTLGALPPYTAVETCVCMGASIGMAKGASEAGVWPVIAVIGDSTFLHSGITPLMDAAAANTDMTVLILDNKTVAMTGTQETIVPSARLDAIVRGLGVDRAHFHVLDAHPRRVDGNAEVLKREIAYHGLSVVVARRACKQIATRLPAEDPVTEESPLVNAVLEEALHAGGVK